MPLRRASERNIISQGINRKNEQYHKYYHAKNQQPTENQMNIKYQNVN